MVDTNVPLAANWKAYASKDCVFACQKTLEAIMDSGHVCLDNSWLIINEYKHKLSIEGQPGAGDMFVKWVHDHQYNPTRCTLVPITPRGTVPRGAPPTDFEEFPDHPGLRNFDPSDRKFVTVAAAHPEHPPILEATDSKWWGWKDVLAECRVQVEFLCPKEIADKYREKMGEM